MKICSIGIMMGDGPVLTHMTEVEHALNEFYLDGDGELRNADVLETIQQLLNNRAMSLWSCWPNA